MSDFNNGGPAFPTENGRQVGHDAYLYEGMSLRDYFAAKAMQAYCSCEAWRLDTPQRETAHAAYCMADAMLAERDK